MAHRAPFLLLGACLFAARGAASDGSCTFYTTDSTNCADNNCGQCFNAGGRPGVKCTSQSTGNVGYECPADVDEKAAQAHRAAGKKDLKGPHAAVHAAVHAAAHAAGFAHGHHHAGDAPNGLAFACMDWSFGSSAMRSAEASFADRTGDDVFMGVGTYGTADDSQRGLGACYRMTVEGVAKDIIAQSINTGSDVAGNQFDLQMGAGGTGLFNTCAGSPTSMYAGGVDVWGCVYGGIDNATACAGLPTYPQVAHTRACPPALILRVTGQFA